MKKAKDLKLSTKIILGIIILLLIIVLYCSIRFLIDKQSINKENELFNTVIAEEESWNLFRLQNDLNAGTYTGFLYDQDYTLDNLPNDYIMALVIDNYIAKHEDFYNSKNYDKTNDSYHVIVSSNALISFAKTLFGPDYNLSITEISYGCGRKIAKSDKNYLIESKLYDGCGLLNSNNTGYYDTYINDYSKKNKDEITINLKVAYIEEIVEETYGVDDYVKTTYNAYSNKDKKKLLKLNIDSTCLDNETANKSCYNYYEDYTVTLKKATDNKYYFYSIAKGK